MSWHSSLLIITLLCSAVFVRAADVFAWPLSLPRPLPGGQPVVSDTSELFLKGPAHIRRDVEISAVVPTVDFMYYPGQTYRAEWSAWGEATVVNGKYYSSIGDHGVGLVNTFVHEYDPATKTLRQVVDVSAVLNQPRGHYTPGKIHGRIDLAKDGWLYFGTFFGSLSAGSDQFHYEGDWILRYNPQTDQTEIVEHAPVGRRSIYGSVVDPDRMIFYGIGWPGQNHPSGNRDFLFFAYDLQTRNVVHSAPMHHQGLDNDLIFSNSTGRVYYRHKNGMNLRRYDPETGEDIKLRVSVGNLVAATEETAGGFVYTADANGNLYAFDTNTEQVDNLGSAVVGHEGYITNLDVDPTGRYLYYMPGADGFSPNDGTPVVQFDLQTRKKTILAFLNPFYQDTYGFTVVGSYGGAIDPSGDELYITWHGNDNGMNVWYESTAMTVVHIPIPEPSSLLLCVVGIGIIALWTRRYSGRYGYTQSPA